MFIDTQIYFWEILRYITQLSLVVSWKYSKIVKYSIYLRCILNTTPFSTSSYLICVMRRGVAWCVNRQVFGLIAVVNLIVVWPNVNCKIIRSTLFSNVLHIKLLVRLLVIIEIYIYIIFAYCDPNYMLKYLCLMLMNTKCLNMIDL